jgi:hypothetical protein
MPFPRQSKIGAHKFMWGRLRDQFLLLLSGKIQMGRETMNFGKEGGGGMGELRGDGLKLALRNLP